MSAQSTYIWQGGGSKAIGFDIVVNIAPGGIEYAGRAVDDTHVSVVSCISAALARPGGGVSHVGYYRPGGSGEGWATTHSGSGASNNPDHAVTVIRDNVSWGYPPPFLYNVWYKGELEFSASTHEWFYNSFDDHQWVESLVVSASVGGEAIALGEITINDPHYFHLGLAADASYTVTGQTRIDLYGNIQ